MTLSPGDRICGYTATGTQVEGAVVRIGATAILLDCGKTISKASAVLVQSDAPARQQLSIFDALAAPPPELPAAPVPPPKPAPNRYAIAHQQARIRVYQEFIDTLTESRRQQWEAAMADAKALARWKAWGWRVNDWSVRKLIRLQAEAQAQIERLERGEEG